MGGQGVHFCRKGQWGCESLCKVIMVKPIMNFACERKRLNPNLQGECHGNFSKPLVQTFRPASYCSCHVIEFWEKVIWIPINYFMCVHVFMCMCNLTVLVLWYHYLWKHYCCWTPGPCGKCPCGTNFPHWVKGQIDIHVVWRQD